MPVLSPEAVIILVATAGALAVVAAAAFAVGRLLPRPRCGSCGAALVGDGRACPVCAAAGGASEDAASQKDGPVWSPRGRHGHHDAKAGYINGGLSRRALAVASAALAVGILVRVAGMAKGLGADVPVPPALLGALTVLGGVVAFVAFVVLDAA